MLDQCLRCDQWLHFNFGSWIWPYHWTIMNRDVTYHANSQLRFVEISEWGIIRHWRSKSHLFCCRTGNRNLFKLKRGSISKIVMKFRIGFLSFGNRCKIDICFVSSWFNMGLNGEMACLREGSTFIHESEITFKLIYVLIFCLKQTIRQMIIF